MDSTQSQEPRYIGPIEIWKSSNSKMADKVKSSSSSSTNTKAKKAAKGAPEIFTLEKANVKYQDRHILKDITWQLKAGDRAVLTGANGKSGYLKPPIFQWYNS